MKKWFDSPVIFTDINGKKIKFERGYNKIPIMIDARQVRIGNYLKPYHGDFVVVTAIQGDGRIIHTPDSIGAVNDIMVEGIPLTIELLTDWCGFEIGASESSSAYYHKRIEREMICVRFMRNVSGVYFCMGNEQNSSYKIKHYLHELQNLVFALTGKELEIKIPAKA